MNIKIIAAFAFALSILYSCEQAHQAPRGEYASKITLQDETDSINYILGAQYGLFCKMALQAAGIDSTEENKRIAMKGFIAGLKRDSTSTNIASIKAIFERYKKEEKEKEE